MVFYLIRHGQTAWNAQSRVMGRTEIPLDETGEKQVIHLVEGIKHLPIDEIYSSPQLRAQQTAQKLAIPRGLKVQSEDLVSEVHFKLWEGKSIHELVKDDLYILRKKNYFAFSHADIESFESLLGRVKKFIEKTGGRDRHVAVVSHADVIRAMIVAFMKVPVESFFQFKVQNASCTVVKKEKDTWSLELLNYTPTPLQGLDI